MTAYIALVGENVGVNVDPPLPKLVFTPGTDSAEDDEGAERTVGENVGDRVVAHAGLFSVDMVPPPLDPISICTVTSTVSFSFGLTSRDSTSCWTADK